MLKGFVPYPESFAKRYREKGYWVDETLGEEFDHFVLKYRNRVALSCQGESVTYGELGERVNRLALHFAQLGLKTYDRMKGDFKWEKDVTPTYFWYNGTVDRYLAGERIDPSKVVRFSSARGDRKDHNARIFPFKVMRGRQPYDSGNNTIAYVNVFGPPGSDAYWAKYDWNAAVASGMKAAGQPYSGKFGFVETSMVWPVNHMVAPKGKALKCADCHGEKGRMDWKALGYKGDPRNPENR